MQTDAIATWLDGLPSSVRGIRVQVGVSKLETVAILALEGMRSRPNAELEPVILEELTPEAVLEELEGNGWPEVRGRLHALTADYKPVSSRVIKSAARPNRPSGSEIPQSQTEVIGRLCLALERSHDAMTRQLEIASEVIADREDVLAHLLADVMDAQSAQTEAEAAHVQAVLDAQVMDAGSGPGDSEAMPGWLGQLLGQYAPDLVPPAPAPGSAPGPAPGPAPQGAEPAPGGVDFADLAARHPEEFRKAVNSKRFAKQVQAVWVQPSQRGAAPAPEEEQGEE